MAIRTISDGTATITLGLTAHQRFSSPVVTNNGAGTFYAPVGGYPGSPNLAQWNFGFYMNVAGGDLADYRFELLYDFDPAVGNVASTHGRFEPFELTIATVQGSQNLGFGYLTTPAPGSITPPTFPSFDPNVAGEYTFALRAYSASNLNTPLGQSAIRVNAVPEPGTLAIFAIGAIGVAGGMVRRRKRRALPADCQQG